MSEEYKKHNERRQSSLLLQSINLSGKFIKYGDPERKEPDCLYKIKNNFLGIEVTEVALGREDNDSSEHEEINAIIRGKKMGKPLTYWEPKQLFEKELTKRISSKIKKEKKGNYKKCDKIWLLIVSIGGAISSPEIYDICKKIQPPENNFDEIFLITTARIVKGPYQFKNEVVVYDINDN